MISPEFRNVGIFAHVDAGKTTITEQFLYAAGAIAAAGSVDKGTATTDTMSVERERGISVRLATTSFLWDGVCINLIDTPGHVDFCAEVERSLRALDCAVLVISAVEGVQAHTCTIFEALQNLSIPTLFFINKIDRIGADVAGVVAEIERELTPDAVVLQSAHDEGETEASVSTLWQAGDPGTLPVDIVESIVERHDQLLGQYVEGETLNHDELDQALAEGTAAGWHYPVLMGVAKNGVGIEPLLAAIVRYLPGPVIGDDEPFSGIVYRIDHTKKWGKTAGVRVFSGSVAIRDTVVNATRSVEGKASEDKVSQIKKAVSGKFEDLRELAAGDIGVICGLSSAQVGDVLGGGAGVPENFEFSAPLLTVMAVPNDEADFANLATALDELSAEDPRLDLEFLPQQRELHLKISGWIQIEVLTAVLQERFGLVVTFTSPTIIYRETPSQIGYGYERYWMPKPCWAIVKFLIEPLPVGSGVQYESQLGVNDVALKYQNEVERTIGKALRQGIKGWEVTDLKITLVEGEEHPVHSRPGDFIIATPMAIMNGLVETDTTLLEPVLAFRITAARELLGSITSDLSRLRGRFGSPEIRGERFVLAGKVPAATSLDYPVQLASRSEGKAKITTRLCGYEPCLLEQGQTTAFRGISPLDRAKYILQARGAIQP